jgi:putative salt-induced outer membrane protein YdiY
MKNNNTHIALAVLTAASIVTTVAQDAPKNGWESSVGLNVTATTGNSESVLFGGSILTKKAWNRNEFSIGADGVFGKTTTDDISSSGQLIKTRRTTAQNYGAFLQYNRLVWEDKGYFLGRADARQDRIADILYRVTLSPGLGYYLVKQKDIELAGEFGPGFVFEKFKGVKEQDYITLRIADRFKWAISDHARILQSTEYLPKVDDFNNYVANSTITLETDINKALKATLTVQDTYRSDPALIAGTMPLLHRKKNDMKVLAGISYTF